MCVLKCSKNTFQDNNEGAISLSTMLSPHLNQRPPLIFFGKIPVESCYVMISGIQGLLPRGINLFYLPYYVAEVYLPTHFIKCHIIFMFIK